MGAVGWPVFEHREAVTAPPGDGTIAHSLIRPAHLALCHDIRYSRCLPEPSGASNPRTHMIITVHMCDMSYEPFWVVWDGVIRHSEHARVHSESHHDILGEGDQGVARWRFHTGKRLRMNM